MDKERIKRIVIIVIIIVVMILFISLINKKYFPIINNNDDNGNAIIDNTHIIYKLGDKVILKDNTEWYVLFDSKNTEKNVTLISKDSVATMSDNNINEYIENIYVDKLVSSLSVSRSEIIEARMLTVSDISKALGADFDTLLKEYNIKENEVFKNETIVDYYDEGNYYSICDKKICNSKNRNLRVVITINKYFVKKTS